MVEQTKRPKGKRITTKPLAPEEPDHVSAGEAEANNGHPAAASSEVSANEAHENAETDQVMMALTMEEYTQMQQELEKAQRQAQENFDGWQRERADFSNYKRRLEREQLQLQQNLIGEIIKKYLVILDDLERALKMRPQQGDGAAWAEGVELVYRKLQNILEAEGVTRIPAENELFDPTIHEAITQEDSPSHESGRVIEVLQQGYRIGDRVLRPALVRVAR